MKKVLFWLSLILGLLVLNQVPSFAMEFSVSPEMIGGLGDIGYGLLGGASFDFNGTEYVIEDYGNLSDQLKAEAANRKTREFLQAYCIARGLPIPNVDPDLPATDAKGFYKSNYFASSVRANWNEYKLAQDILEQNEALRFPINPQSFADWSEYNNFWYDKYIDSFYTDDVITVDPDPNYLTYIDNINGAGFWWKNYANSNGSGVGLRVYPPDLSTWVTQGSMSTSQNWIYVSSCSIRDLNIVSNNGIYSCRVSIPRDQMIYNFVDGGTSYQVGTPWDNKFLYSGNAYDFNFSASGTLANVLNQVQNKFRNVNIYVDGIAWSLAGAPANPLIPTFPDVIGGTQDDPYPAYDIVFPDTTNYDGTFDLTSIFDAIKEAIIGASDSDDTTSGTLTKEKVSDTFKDRAGEAVGELTKTMDAVLDDSFPLEGTLNYPVLPPIPELPISNAFMGTTILAQLIDACQQILPEPLTLVFWGIIFILFIIGLIKILHK